MSEVTRLHGIRGILQAQFDHHRPRTIGIKTQTFNVPVQEPTMSTSASATFPYPLPTVPVAWLKRDLLLYANTIGIEADELQYLYVRPSTLPRTPLEAHDIDRNFTRNSRRSPRILSSSVRTYPAHSSNISSFRRAFPHVSPPLQLTFPPRRLQGGLRRSRRLLRQ